MTAMTATIVAALFLFRAFVEGSLAVDDSQHHPTTKLLRGDHQEPRGLASGSVGKAHGRYKKLDPSGCTVLEKVGLCVSPGGGDPAPCDEGAREYACAESSTSMIFEIDNDMVDMAKNKRPGIFDFDDDDEAGDVLESALTEFVGDADIDLETGKVTFVKGRFGRAKGRGKDGDNGNGNENKAPRRLAQTGSRTVLVLKVVDVDGSTLSEHNTERHLADSIFGGLVGGEDMVNLGSQYTACSHGQLNFRPVNDRDGGTATNGATVGQIKNGVTTVNVMVAGDANTLHNAAIAALEDTIGHKGGADYVMVCLPGYSMETRYAYAYLGYYNSVYKDSWCTYPTYQLHMIGHNLGLHHSGEGSDPYGDYSGVMGFYAYHQDDFTDPVVWRQKLCFKGPKNWQLGWFTLGHVELRAANNYAFSGKLYGTTMYDPNTSNEKMILRLISGRGNDHYVSFNHVALMNSGMFRMFEGPNQVLVHGATGAHFPKSMLMAKLGANTSYDADIYGDKFRITVGVINTGEGWAEVTVGPPPTHSPTPTPTPPPTPTPTPPPTPTPTPPPTPEPTLLRKTVVCGSSGSETCTAPPTPADPSELHEVRCCSDMPKMGWVIKGACSTALGRHVWGESDIDGKCHQLKTYEEAETICADVGGRICTKEELEFDCTRGSGCGYDNQMIWSSTTYATTTQSPPQ